MKGLSLRRMLTAGLAVALSPATIAVFRPEVRQHSDELDRFALTCAAVASVVTLGGVVTAAALHRRGQAVQRTVLIGTAAASGLTAGVWSSVITLWLAADRGTPAPWAPVWLFAWPVVLVIAVRVACGGPPRQATRTAPDPALPRVQLPTDGEAVWERQLTAGFFLAGGALLAVLGAVVFTVSGPVTVVCWVMALLSVLIARMRLRLDDVGVTLSPWGLPTRSRIPYRRIVAARTEVLRPLRWGGPGERVLAGDSGLLVRSGPGLVIVLGDGRRLGILMAEPEVPAGIINAQLDRLRPRADTATEAWPSRP